MRIIITHQPLDPLWNGIGATLTYLFSETIMWNPRFRGAFDMYDRCCPDLIFCQTSDLNVDLQTVINRYNIPVIIYGTNYPVDILPLLIIVPQGCDCNNINLPYYIIKPAANIVQYSKGYIKEIYKSDVFFHSNIPIDSKLTLILRKLTENGLSVKICGEEFVSLPEYLGQGNPRIISNLIKSAKCIMDYNSNSRFDAGINKKSYITNEVQAYGTTYKTLDDLISCVNYIMTNDQTSMIKEHYEICLENTYFDRLYDIFNLSNCTNKDKIIKLIQDKKTECMNLVL